jgi:hypothetical protein
LITTDFGKRRRTLGVLVVAVFTVGVLFAALSGAAFDGLAIGLFPAITAGLAGEVNVMREKP